MLSVEWREPIPLSAHSLKSVVPQASPAVAVLGELGPRGELLVRRVIRSDSNIRAELLRLVGRYGYYKVVPCTSPAVAYVLECELYHRLHPSDCLTHPGEPDGLKVLCPFCGFRMKPKIVA